MKRKRYYSNPLKEYRERRGRPAQHREKLTDAFVLSCHPREREYSVGDTECDGMSLRVRPSGLKTFTYRPRAGSDRRARSLGRSPDISVEQARKRAFEWEAEILSGSDFSQFSAPAPKATIGKLYPTYLQGCGAEKAWRRKLELAFERRILPAIGNERLGDVDAGVIDRIVPPTAPFHTRSQTRSILSAFLTWTVRTGRFSHNPLKGWPSLRRPQPKWRHDPLGRLEMADVWEASGALRAPWRGIVRLVLLTGEPIERILSLTRSEIEDGYEHYVRKCNFLPNAMTLLLSLDLNPGEYVFGTGNGSRPRVPPSTILRQLRDATHRKFSWRSLSQAIQSLANGLPGGLREWDENHLEILVRGYGYEVIDADL